MSREFNDLLAVAACGAVVAVAEAVTITFLRRAAVIDMPGHRSSHTVPMPRGKDIPIAAGLLVAAVLIGDMNASVFAFAVAAFGLLGFANEKRGLTPGWRLIMQAVGGTIVAVVLVGGVVGPTAMLVLLVVLGAVWITVDGISGAHAPIAGLVHAGLRWWRHDGVLASASVAVAVGALAFLPWNAGQAPVFLGDADSYALGAALAILVAYSVLQGTSVEPTFGSLALYIADTAWTLLRRIHAGERCPEAHRRHVYQRWCDAGWSHQRVTMTPAATTVLFSLLGAASLGSKPTLRAAADLAGTPVVVTYLRSPTSLARRRVRAEAS